MRRADGEYIEAFLVHHEGHEVGVPLHVAEPIKQFERVGVALVADCDHERCRFEIRLQERVNVDEPQPIRVDTH